MTGNPLFNVDRSLVISGAGFEDETFTGEFGGRYLTYNVSKAWRDCRAGRHGKPYLFDIAPCYEANRRVEVDYDKVLRFMNQPAVLMRPLMLVIEYGQAWLIDGHTRLRALYRLGVTEFAGYAIEDQHRKNYLLLFNGKAEMPETLRHPDIIGKAGLS